MATLIKTNGEVSEVKPASGKKFTLEELQKLVGGYIERVQLKGGRNLIVNEDGKVIGLPRNQEASRTAYEQAYGLMAGDWIVGDAVVCEKGEM